MILRIRRRRIGITVEQGQSSASVRMSLVDVLADFLNPPLTLISNTINEAHPRNLNGAHRMRFRVR